MEPLQRLLEEEAIKRLKARYFRCLDTKDWDGLMSVFADDATFLMDQSISKGDSWPKVEGKGAIAKFVVNDLGQSVHHGHMPEIDIISETEARGIWAMESVLDRANTLINGAGHYFETYRKTNGEWLITSVHLTWIRLVSTTKERIAL